MFFSVAAKAQDEKGEFIGKLALEKVDDRSFELLRDFMFRDSLGTEWLVPKGARVDGASIPKVFWSIIGAPGLENILKLRSSTTIIATSKRGHGSMSIARFTMPCLQTAYIG